MVPSSTSKIIANPSSEDDEIDLSTVPQEPSWRPPQVLYKFQGFWSNSDILKGVILFQKNFIPQPNDILLCSIPKSGTTWLKSLSFAISTRAQFFNSPTNFLLTKDLPHDIVPFIEFLYSKGLARDPENPLISTHLPFTSLPESILNSNTKIIYVCRNPKDVIVSQWHFVSKKITFKEACEKYCNGVTMYGPYWDHVLGYWKASLEFPERVLFLKYEDLKNDTSLYVKKIADFMGFPFSIDEEKQGMVEKIVELCSFESLSNLEVNKSKTISSQMPFKVENNEFFRKGEIGDWKNYFSDEMAEKFDQITQQKCSSFGLYI